MKQIAVGEVYGRLSVLERTKEYNKSNKVLYKCSCECGETTLVTHSQLTKNMTPSCGKCTTRMGHIVSIGMRVNDLTLEYIDRAEPIKYTWRCVCGNSIDAPISSVTKNYTKSCGCLQKRNGIANMNAKYADKKFNMLTFVSHAEKWAGPAEGKNPIAMWKCDCGTQKEARLGDVLGGKTTCCGCVTGRDGGKSLVGSKWNKLTLVDFCRAKGNNNLSTFRCDCGNVIKAELQNVANSRKKSCGCDMSEILRASRGFTLNETVFDSISEESAYWIGFLLADGNVFNNTVTINLKTSDTAHLEKFREFVGGNQVISVKKDIRMSGYAFGSIRIAKALNSYGVVPNKSMIAKPDDRLLNNRHFWRGLVDGDGSVIIGKNGSNYIALCGTRDVCQGLLDFAKQFISTKAIVHKRKNIFKICIGVGSKSSKPFIEELYKNTNISLDRKQEAANKIMSK